MSRDVPVFHSPLRYPQLAGAGLPALSDATRLAGMVDTQWIQRFPESLPRDPVYQGTWSPRRCADGLAGESMRWFWWD
jgi:hypothetical protein